MGSQGVKILSLLVAFVVIHLPNFACANLQGNHNPSTTLVHSCSQLRQALLDPSFSKITVCGQISCTRSQWNTPVVVNRTVDIYGLRNTNRLTLIDWKDLHKVLISEGPDVRLGIHNLVIYQDDMGITGLNIGFLGTRNGARLELSGCVIGVRFCLAPVTTMRTSIPERPGFAPGDQAVEGSRDGGLHLKDVVLYWPGIDSIWSMCETMFICGPRTGKGPVLRRLLWDMKDRKTRNVASCWRT